MATIRQDLEKRNNDHSWEFRDPTLIEKGCGRVERVATGTPVRWGHVPTWLKKRTRPYALDLTCYTTAHPLFGGGAEWLDHWGTTIDADGEEDFVSEPYHLNAEGMRGLLHFAAALDLYFIVRAASAYFPTHSLRIKFMPKERIAARVAAMVAKAHGERGNI